MIVGKPVDRIRGMQAIEKRWQMTSSSQINLHSQVLSGFQTRGLYSWLYMRMYRGVYSWLYRGMYRGGV